MANARSLNNKKSTPIENASPLPNEEMGSSLLEYLEIILKYKRTIIVVNVLVAFVTILVLFISLKLPPHISFLPNKYTASAKLTFTADSSGGGLSRMLAAAGGMASMLGISAPSGDQSVVAVEILKSRDMMDAVITKFDFIKKWEIKENPKTSSRSRFQNSFSLQQDIKTRIVTITYTDISPELPAQVLQEMLLELNRKLNTIAAETVESEKSFLEERLATVTTEMIQLEQKMKVFQKKYGVLDLESQATAQLSKLAELKAELYTKEVSLKTLSQVAGANNPQAKLLTMELQNLRQLVREMESGFVDYDGGLPTQSDLPDLSFQFLKLKRDLMIQEKVFEVLTGQIEIAKINELKNINSFQVIESAEPQEKKSGPSRGKILMQIVVVFFAFSLLVAIGYEKFLKSYLPMKYIV